MSASAFFGGRSAVAGCPDTPEATASVVRWVDAATTALRVLADAEVAVA